jgi:hypothetical protein
MQFRIYLFALLCVPLIAVAQDESASTDTESAPISREALESAETDTLELDPLEVTGEGWSFDQEVTLRLIRQAYGRPKSQRKEDKNVWVCWIDDATGSHLSYLGCARNGDIWALNPDQGIGNYPSGDAGYGRIQVSSHPVNRWKLERVLEALPGNAEFDLEFTNMVLAGEKPARDIPDDEESDQFVSAYLAVGELEKEGASEDYQIAAIQAEGLSLARYNRIAELVETYDSLRSDIAKRLEAAN